MTTPTSTPTTFEAGDTNVQWDAPENTPTTFEGGATYASVAKLALFGPSVSFTNENGDCDGDIDGSSSTRGSMYPSVAMFAGCQQGETFEPASGAHLEQAADRVGTLEDKSRDEDARWDIRAGVNHNPNPNPNPNRSQTLRLSQRKSQTGHSCAATLCLTPTPTQTHRASRQNMHTFDHIGWMILSERYPC
mmetsp:Transcript_87572/g.249030  ORF Transcript_87572/g.249030 Transcript_87572/m.249030 type:complete len:191 (+) Transcript_87572:672-1244(+)